MEFARVGGLSPVKYKPVPDKEPTFHFPPPRRNGIYAFVWPYVEPFLWAWSEEHKRDFKINGYRKFKFEGYLWCHHLDEGSKYSSNIEGSWIRIHTNDFEKIFKENLVSDIKYLKKGSLFRGIDDFVISNDPYKRGRNGFMSRDHLEVFIEASECGKIR